MSGELAQYRQLSVTQRLAYKGLDDQIKDVLVELNENFEKLDREMKSQRPADLGYYLTRIQTLADDGLKDVNKAIDIARENKYEGASFFDDIQRALTNIFQWAKKELGFYHKNNKDIQDALKKKTGTFGVDGKMISKFNDVKNKVGTSFGQQGHALVNKQDSLTKPRQPK